LQRNCNEQLRESQFAKIAQLVEHNLAKVGVAGSSPVFRSCFIGSNDCLFFLKKRIAQMAELVDALVSGTSDRKVVQVRFLFWAQCIKAQVVKLVYTLL
jgi:hypothetical protein